MTLEKEFNKAKDRFQELDDLYTKARVIQKELDSYDNLKRYEIVNMYSDWNSSLLMTEYYYKLKDVDSGEIIYYTSSNLIHHTTYKGRCKIIKSAIIENNSVVIKDYLVEDDYYVYKENLKYKQETYIVTDKRRSSKYYERTGEQHYYLTITKNKGKDTEYSEEVETNLTDYQKYNKGDNYVKRISYHTKYIDFEATKKAEAERIEKLKKAEAERIEKLKKAEAVCKTSVVEASNYVFNQEGCILSVMLWILVMIFFGAFLSSDTTAASCGMSITAFAGLLIIPAASMKKSKNKA